MRAMVDAAEGMEILWINKSHPNDRRSVRDVNVGSDIEHENERTGGEKGGNEEFPQGRNYLRNGRR